MATRFNMTPGPPGCHRDRPSPPRNRQIDPGDDPQDQRKGFRDRSRQASQLSFMAPLTPNTHRQTFSHFSLYKGKESPLRHVRSPPYSMTRKSTVCSVGAATSLTKSVPPGEEKRTCHHPVHKEPYRIAILVSRETLHAIGLFLGSWQILKYLL